MCQWKGERVPYFGQVSCRIQMKELPDEQYIPSGFPMGP